MKMYSEKFLRVVLFCVGCFLFVSNNVFALSKFATGFYWPLENFTYSTAGTWLGPGLGSAGPHGHIGVDMLATEGTPVYAVADGWVFRDPSRHGWGDGNVAVLVKHKLADDREFIVLYGHVTESSALKKGDKVYAGKTIIGRLGPYFTSPHLHLGVVPPNTNYGPTYGYTTNNNHNGFVDPINFLNTHYPKNQNSSGNSGGDSSGDSSYFYVSEGNIHIAWSPSNVPCNKASVWSYNQTCSAENSHPEICNTAHYQLLQENYNEYSKDKYNTMFFGSIEDFQQFCQ